MKTNEPGAALRRYETLSARAGLPAIAWTGMGIRLEIAARTVAGETATKLRDRAADCRARASRARQVAP